MEPPKNEYLQIQPKVSLNDITRPNFIREQWKKLRRKVLLSSNLSDLYLDIDPIDYAGIEWAIEDIITNLCEEIESNRYQPEQARIVRTAKGNGLSRPQAYLDLRDLLLYRSIMHKTEKAILDGNTEWVGFRKSEKNSSPDESGVEPGYSGSWYKLWLKEYGVVSKMLDIDDVKFIVETDISNYFGSIQPETIREHLYSQTILDKVTSRLCIKIIEGVMPKPDYARESPFGLPQEISGSSRTIAHSLLFHLDSEFFPEGQQNRYSRFMDDITIGVKSKRQGLLYVSRLQARLEELGLYINGAKTKIESVEDYKDQILALTNGEIQKIEYSIDSSSRKLHDIRVYHPQESTMTELKALATQHRELFQRPRRWDRVLKRLYTLQRKIGIEDWMPHWQDDLITNPKLAGAILEYVRSFPLTECTLDSLIRTSQELSGLYTDIGILIPETLATTPVEADPELWKIIADQCIKEFQRNARRGAKSAQHDQIASAWMTPAWKFANPAQRSSLISQAKDATLRSRTIGFQLTPLIASSSRNIDSPSKDLSTRVQTNIDFLRSLIDGNKKALEIGYRRIQPRSVLLPNRYMTRPRSIPLIEIIGDSDPDRQRRNTRFESYLNHLQLNPDRLRDRQMEAIFEKWTELFFRRLFADTHLHYGISVFGVI
ncbi:RNA-directed DNA polymerase [Glycomyces xiaoerkulensis]|uniref:RNA-directed DNA polymerase n=1 Tax=Glycomyces xiaoerkulensis TaxID=2038139 RepID=UPI000C2695AD|nr:RNA-directed DNA polymerase [Glycomyces xiaoerkulensis]